MKVFKTLSIASLLLLLWASSSSAIDVCGLIQDDIWSIADSPVMVTCDLNIAELTINPGVEVQVSGNHEIVVNGILRALGNREAPVVFKPAAENAAGWEGIYFEDTIEGSEFLWTRIEGSNSSGLHLVRSYPTLDYVTFRGNSAANGGGLFAELLNTDLHLNHCLFADNYADTAGGAIYAIGPTGPDDAALVVSECVFLQNTAGTTTDTRHNTRGGALNIQGNSRILRSSFRRNEARAYTIFAAGGRFTQGVAIFAGEGLTEIIATAFIANACRMGAHGQTPDASRAYGGAVKQSSGELLISNSLVAENILSVSRNPDLRGSGLHVAGGISSIVNTSMAANSHHAVYRNGGDIVMLNSILFTSNNSGAQISDASNTVIATYCDIQNGFDGEGNIGLDPIFDEHFRIVSPSPAIDAGHPGSEYDDLFPPGLGGPRNDMGYTGGPLAVFSATADAGPDQDVDERTTVTLDGTRSIDLDGDSLSYSWFQISGPTATLSSSTAARPTFTAAEVTELTSLTFQLVVNGGDADSAPVTVNITVHDVNRAPTADAGPDQDVDERPDQDVDERTIVTLDGTGSFDPDGDLLSYSWRQISGPPATLSGPSNARPTLEVPSITELTTLTFELVVNDGDGDSAPDTVDITVHDVNRPPTANAGPNQDVDERTTVTLDGSGSLDPDGDALDYLWRQIFGPTATLSDSTSSRPTFTAAEVTAPTTLTFELVVNDRDADSAPVTVNITVHDVNRAPTADAGPDQNVNERAIVTLDGTGSIDADGDLLSYSWRQESGLTAILSGPSNAQPTLEVPSVTGLTTLTFELVVSDGDRDSAPDTVEISVTDTDSPQADFSAIPITGRAPLRVDFDASGSSDPDGQALDYEWDFGDETSVQTGSAVMHTFEAPGVFTVILTVRNASGGSGTMSMDIRVDPDSSEPGIPEEDPNLPGDNSDPGQGEPTACGTTCGAGGAVQLLLMLIGVISFKVVRRRHD